MKNRSLIGEPEVRFYPDHKSRRHLKVPAAIEATAHRDIVKVLHGTLLLLPKCQRVAAARGHNRKRDCDSRCSNGRRRHTCVNGIEPRAYAEAQVRT